MKAGSNSFLLCCLPFPIAMLKLTFFFSPQIEEREIFLSNKLGNRCGVIEAEANNIRLNDNLRQWWWIFFGKAKKTLGQLQSIVYESFFTSALHANMRNFYSMIFMQFLHSLLFVVGVAFKWNFLVFPTKDAENAYAIGF